MTPKRTGRRYKPQLLQNGGPLAPVGADTRDLALAQLCTIIDHTGHGLCTFDLDGQRLIQVNEPLLQWLGLSSSEFLEQSPQALFGRDAGERAFNVDLVRSAGGQGLLSSYQAPVTTTTQVSGMPSAVRNLQLHSRLMQLGQRQYIVCTVQDLSAQLEQERASERLRRMYATLSDTNEAILRATGKRELYQRVCEAAVAGSKLIMAAIMQPDFENECLTVRAHAARSGFPTDIDIRPRLDPNSRSGRGPGPVAFRTGLAAVSNNFRHDPNTTVWHAEAARLGIGSAAAVPLMRDGKVTGVMLFCADEPDSFDSSTIGLLERLAANLVFALVHFEQQQQRLLDEARIEFLATRDSLTNLPNRALFTQLLQHDLEASRRHHHDGAVLLIDLDRFKLVNDTLGHDTGDQLLTTVAERFTQCLRSSDVLARFGGDEFAVMLPHTSSRTDIAKVARKLLAAAMQPVPLNGQDYRITASIGIACYPESSSEPQADVGTLLKRADMAMYAAKEEGRNDFQFYVSHIQQRSLARMTLETQLAQALSRDELHLFYQPKVDLKDNSICGIEALLRWDSASLGAISPTQLIPVAEESGLIIPIGYWVLRTACQQYMAWKAEGLNPPPMAVNLSQRQFNEADLAARIEDLLIETGMPADCLELEVTESMMMQDPARTVRVLNKLKGLGIRIAVDDFGTGYSSLARIKQFPLDTIKVDRSFIRDIPINAEDKSIARTIIALAHSLKLSVVAEGVENAAQCAFLKSHDCHQVQGYFFARPEPADQMAGHLAMGLSA
jgi:diguanylate cyclase (GGDEF)-like protein